MFREPEATETKTNIKVDLSAPARSGIRRQRTVRYRRSPSSSRTHGITDRRALLEAIRRGDSPATSARLNSDRTISIEIEANHAHAEASRRRRHESGRAILRDALSYEHPGHSMSFPREGSAGLSIVRPPTPTASFSRSPPLHHRHHTTTWRSNSESLGSQRPVSQAQSTRIGYIPSPPYTSDDVSGRSSPQRDPATYLTASLTPRFAPAHPYQRSGSMMDRQHQHPLQLEDDQPSRSSLNELPPLRRFSRRRIENIARANHGTPVQEPLDGLGDRRRSFSPDDDTWATLLSTMTPDERLPSIHSSFTSATTSGSSFPTSEELDYFGSIADQANSSASSVDAYPIICDNTDSDLSETEDEALALVQGATNGDSSLIEAERYADSVRSSNRSRVLLENARAAQLASQRQILEGEEELRRIQRDLRRLQRHVPQEWVSTAGRSSLHSRPSRERL